MCVCVHFSIAVVGQESIKKDTLTPLALLSPLLTHLLHTLQLLLFSYNPIPSLTHSSLFHSPSPCTLFSLLCKSVYCLSPPLAHLPHTSDPCIALSLHTPVLHKPLPPWCTCVFDHSPSIFTRSPPPPTHSHTYSPTRVHTPLSWPLPSLCPPPGWHTCPRLWGHLLVRGRAGMRSRGHFSSSPPPRPAPPSIPHRLPGSRPARPARPPLRGGLRRRRRRKEPPFATAERTGRAEPSRSREPERGWGRADGDGGRPRRRRTRARNLRGTARSGPGPAGRGTLSPPPRPLPWPWLPAPPPPGRQPSRPRKPPSPGGGSSERARRPGRPQPGSALGARPLPGLVLSLPPAARQPPLHAAPRPPAPGRCSSPGSACS